MLPDSPASQALIEGKPFAHIADCAEIDHPVFRSAAEFAGIRTVLFVPLRKDGAFLGLISAARLEVRPFSEKEIALLQNFAAQAVIAMENARLITETREALEQQTATTEVLQVINSSPGDLAPVFDAILEKALILCGAAFGTFRRYDGERFHLAASRGAPAELVNFQREPRAPGPFGLRLLQGETVIHVPDIIEGDSYRAGSQAQKALVELGGARSYLMVALRKEEILLGYFSFYRQEVRPFSEKQIALLQNFAAQAVIAMENARLITETREALDQQTATAEVLGVINSSPGDLAPVFDAILDKAHTVCGAGLGALVLYDGEQLRGVAMRGYPEEYASLVRKGGPANLVTAFNRLQRGERIVHVLDAAAIRSPRCDNASGGRNWRRSHLAHRTVAPGERAPRIYQRTAARGAGIFRPRNRAS